MGEKTFFDELNDYAYEYPLTKKIEKFTGIPAILVVVIGILYLIYQAWIGAYADLIATCVGTIYPALRSISALETKYDDFDDKIWLTYWCVYGATVVADQFTGWILDNIPFYFFGKLCFFLWLQLPGPQMGAAMIYNYVFKPLYRLFGKELKSYADRSTEALYDFDGLVKNGMSEMKDQATA